MTSQIKVGMGGADPGVVTQAWTEVLDEVGQEGSEARATVERYEIGPDRFDGASVVVTQQEGDFGISLLIAVGVPVAIHVLESMWDDLVRPRLRDKFEVDGGPAE